MLSQKYDNPMLGIYGGHLLLHESKPDLDLLKIVVGNLRGLLGIHPDVEALALALPNDSSDYVFKYPPMLRQSWGRILGASVTKPQIVPAGSPVSSISGRLWGSDLWLQWLNSASQTVSFPKRRSVVHKTKDDYSATEKILVDYLQPTRTPSAQTTAPLFLEGLPAFALETTNSIDADRQAITEETMVQLVQALGMPRAEIENMVAEISDNG
jgi:hypothetical protein